MSPKPDAGRIGQRIIELRRARGLSQTKLAESMPGGHYANGPNLSRWERGLQRPNAASLELLADALGVEVEELVASDG